MNDITRYTNCYVYNKFKSSRKFDDPRILDNKILLYHKNLMSVYEESPEFSKVIPIIKYQLELNKLNNSFVKNSRKNNSKLLLLRKKLLDESQKINNEKNINNTNILPAINNTSKNPKTIQLRMINLNRTIDLRKKQKKLIPSLSTKDIDSKKIYKKKNIFLFNNNKENDSRLNTESEKNSKYDFYNEKKNINSFILSNLNRSMDIIQKCESGVKKGIYMDKFINKYKKISLNNKLVIPEIKTIEEQKIENQTKDLKKEIHEPIIREEENNDVIIQMHNFKMINQRLKDKQAKDDKIIETAIKLVKANYDRTKSFKKKINQINRKNKRIKLLHLKTNLFKKKNINQKINLLDIFHKNNKNNFF